MNTSGVSQFNAANAVVWPANTILVHPTNGGLVLASWLSPGDGTVDLDYSATSRDTLSSDGITFIVEVNDASNTLDSDFISSLQTTGTQNLFGIPVSDIIMTGTVRLDL